MVIAWLKHDWNTRRTSAPVLLEEVRLGLVSAEKLTELYDDKILEIPGCKEQLEEVLRWKRSEYSKVELSRKMPHLFATRRLVTVSLNLKFCFQPFYAAVNSQLELTLLKDRQRCDTVSTSNLKVYEFREWRIFT